MKRLAVLFFIFFSLPLAFADYNRFNVPDSAEIRRELTDTWFTESVELLYGRRPEIRANYEGRRFQIRAEENDTDVFIYVSPETKIPVDVYSSGGVETVIKTEHPGDISGSWVLVRNKITGNPVSIRYYFSADSDVFVQISPLGRVSIVDMVIFNNYASRGVQLALPFSSFYTASFEQLYEWTRSVIPWNYVIVSPEMYHSSLQMIQVIRENLPSIVFADDAMYDESGMPVSVLTGKAREKTKKDSGKLSLSNAGFVKWVVDGLIYPLTGSYTYRDPLLVSTVAFKPVGLQGIIDDKYDLSFALNWTRNLAAASLSVYTNKKYLYKDSGVDVTIEPFSAELINGTIVNTAGYIKDTGYAVSKLKAILYVLSATEPSFCYLAAIRSTAKTVPEVRPFNNCAVIFPFFDSGGHFDCTVFENAKELSLPYFMQRYKNDFVHLVRVGTEDRFFPQTEE
ncbi:hypothetical protein [Treponema parvum]|uniref:hypothetical protein n=1 Tax=Treponema parvum TaxID=138851 RepID=UPI001AEC1DD3|nr:hypothetical protein [Treponema parvum]QTQ15641.1 hypothetical protein HXT04_02385 [Treponema parvum]